MFVSVRPSVFDQSAGHLDMSTVQPSGPVRVLPSADSPHLFSLIRLTIASRCLVHSASHSAMVWGWGPAAVVDVLPPAADVDVAALDDVAPPAVVAVDE